ncbi:MAG: hypothetical protein A3E87_03030 [Gammaproteobacteria bacterium RIFCSPHIGHO2_12_FULL_35_23]|nr:MAG: hypothetical protein A3E87_03030 [Gammaproteobacteria bacterium RIFCSPHIGHO2_12_FULL_35_23]
MITTPLSALSYLLAGFKLLHSKGLKRYVYMPLMISMLIFIVLISWASHLLLSLVDRLNSTLPHWLQWLSWLLWPLFVISAGVFIIYTFNLIANWVGAPFNSLLSQKVEELISQQTSPSQDSIFSSLKDLPRLLKRQFALVLYYIPRLVLLGILFLIPGINGIVALLWLMFNAWTLAMQYLDYPMDNHKISLANMRQTMQSQKLKYLIFGSLIMLGMLIPLINFFIMPAAVIAATLMWLDENKS